MDPLGSQSGFAAALIAAAAIFCNARGAAGQDADSPLARDAKEIASLSAQGDAGAVVQRLDAFADGLRKSKLLPTARTTLAWRTLDSLLGSALYNNGAVRRKVAEQSLDAIEATKTAEGVVADPELLEIRVRLALEVLPRAAVPPEQVAGVSLNIWAELLGDIERFKPYDVMHLTVTAPQDPLESAAYKGPFASGMDPAAIADPTLRKQYVAYHERMAEIGRNSLSYGQFCRIRYHHLRELKAVLKLAYAGDAANERAGAAEIEKYISDPAARAELLNAVKSGPALEPRNGAAPQFGVSQFAAAGPPPAGAAVKRYELTEPAPAGAVAVRGRYTSASLQLAAAIADAFPAKKRLSVAGDDHASFGRFCGSDDPFGVLIHEGNLTRDHFICRAIRFPVGGPQPEAFLVGNAQLILVASNSNPIKSLGLAAIGNALSQKALRWSDVGGAGTSAIRCYGSLDNSWTHSVVQEKCMTRLEGTAIPNVRQTKILEFRDDLVACADAKAVVARVRADANALGCFACCEPLSTYNLQGVKVIPVAATEGGPAIMPPPDLAVEPAYPLATPLFLFLHPKAPAVARKFCEFATGPEAARAIRQSGLWPQYDRLMWLGKQRVAAVKAGKGAAVGVVGDARGETLVKELALKYVEEQEAVQVHYRKQAAQAEAARAMLDGKAELMLVEGEATDGLASGGGQDHPHPGPLPSREREVEKGLRKVVLGQAALGVVVHPKTLLKSLSVDELRQVFCGQIKKWPSAGKGAGPAIHGYGLRSDSAVMEIYRRMLGKESGARGQGAGDEDGGKGREVRGEGRVLQLTTEADTAKVVLAVARDPDGIGLVDLSQMPKDDKSVTLLAIDLEKGRGEANGTSVQPVAGDVPEDYPLVQPCALYVSPTAGDAARNFFTWLASAGSNAEGSSNGGADNDRVELLARFGLVPPKIDDAAATPGAVAKPDIVAPAGDDVATLGKEPQIELEEPRAPGSDSADTLRRDTTAKNAKGAKTKKVVTAIANAPAGNRTATQAVEPSDTNAGDAADSSDAMAVLLGFLAVGGIVSVVAVSRVKRRKQSVRPHAASRQSRATGLDVDYDMFENSAGSTGGGDGTLANDRGPAVARVEKTFDPYHVWLSIPPDEQPASHYRLLGLAAFESDREVIEEAADRQMAHLRTFQLGQYAALSQGLLNEVSAAKGCLLSPTKKPIYDAHLRRRLAHASV